MRRGEPGDLLEVQGSERHRCAECGHIHKGRKGVSGPVAIAFEATYKAAGCAKAPKAVVEAIETNPNRYYANIHNAKYPGGPLRGQLVAGMAG